MITKISALTLLGLAGLISANLSLSPNHMSEPAKGRIINGVPVRQGGARYQAAILRNGTFICGGSFISNRTVLTSAKCITQAVSSARPLFTVRYGNVDRTSIAYQASVSNLISHPSYNSLTFDFNIGLIILEKAINFTANSRVAPIALADYRPDKAENLTLTGWGPTSLTFGLPSTLPAILHRAHPLKYITNEKCQLEYPTASAITPNVLCAVSNIGQIPCGQDEGGPLVNLKSGLQYGVYSWRTSGCMNSTKPSVYSSVPDLKRWIVFNMV